jgi:hypothetical protein
MTIRVNRSTSFNQSYEESGETNHNGGVVSESFLLGKGSTLPLIFLEGEIQQREFHKPGLSMGPINILEEDNPEIIKEYLCGFIDLPTSLLNASSAYDNERSACIDLGDITSPNDYNMTESKATWLVSEVAVSPPKMVFGSIDIDKSGTNGDEKGVYETTMASRVVDKSNSAMDDILDEFSVELEKKLKENGFGSDDPIKEDTPQKNGVWWMKEKPRERVVDDWPEDEKAVDNPEILHKQGSEGEEPTEPSQISNRESHVDFEETLDGIIEIMLELESENKGTNGERAQLREMIKEIEEKKSVILQEATGTLEDEIELMGTVRTVEDKMNELKMEKIDSEVEKAEVEGAIAGIEDKMTELELSQIGSDAEKTELQRMMNGIEDQIAEIEDGSLEAEVAKAELEGMMAGIEDMMTDLEISQLGTDAEKTELRRMMDEIEKKISTLEKRNDTEMENKLKGMEEQMAQMEIQIQGTENKMQELKTEIEVRKFTIDYIENLEDRGELEALCGEVGLSCEGSEIELRERLLDYVEGMPKEQSKEDPRFTKENIESIKTKAELVTLCEEAGLKKSGKKEELRKRLLEYIEEKEQKAEQEKQKEQRFTKENIESITSKAELIALCDEANLKKSGTKDELRERLLEYAKEHEAEFVREPISSGHSIGLGAPDKLVYAVMGDMYKHLSLEMGDTVSEYVNDLEDFIRSILEVRKELGVESDEVLKSVVIKPNKDKTAEVLNKLRTPFLDKVKAENLEVVEPDEEWEGIKLNMDMDKELIAVTFKAQSTKIQMLLRMQPPQKIKKIIEEKGEYTLGVEGYPVTITPAMLTFKEITPENFEIREIESGMLYIEKEVIKSIREGDLPPPPPDYIEEPAPLDEKPKHNTEEPHSDQAEEEEPQEEETIEPPPSPPQRKKRKKRTPRKKGFIGKLKSRLKK